MKRIILKLIALCLIIFPWIPCHAEDVQLARMNPWVAGSVAATSSCGSAGSDETGASLASFGSSDGATFYEAQSFISSRTGDLKAVSVKMIDTATPNADVYMSLCTSDGGTPAKPTTTCTTSTSHFGPGTTPATSGTATWFEFLFDGYPVENGQTVFIRLQSANSSADSAYYWYYNNAGSTHYIFRSVETPISWSTYVNNATAANFRATTCANWASTP